MDMEIEIKEEPVWLEETTNTSLDNGELASEMISLQQESKSELIESEPTQENKFKPSAYIKEEIFTEQHTVNQLDLYIKEENKVENPEASMALCCSVCLKTFKSVKTLRQHRIVHSDQRPFSCCTCGMTFKRAANMEQHSFRHNNIRIFSCSICGKTYKTASDLRSHCVTHSNKYPFFCSVCGKTFKSKAELTRHCITHSDDRPFICSMCGMTFKRLANYREHRTRH